MTTAARNLVAEDVPFELEDFKSSAWLPELLQILGPTAGRLETVPLRTDLDAMLETYSATIVAQEQFEAARDEMRAVLSRDRI